MKYCGVVTDRSWINGGDMIKSEITYWSNKFYSEIMEVNDYDRN